VLDPEICSEPEESLILLLTRACDLCGREFGEGEEFYLLKRVCRVPGYGGDLVGEVVSEVAMCITACGDEEIVKI